MLYSSACQIMKYFLGMLCQNIVNENKYKELNDFIYFTFPFINCLKKLLHFLHFKKMVNLLIYNMSY